jgi:toxin ParE1/3/4
MKIEWLPVAERNRDQQLDYLAERNPGAAVKMGDAIDFAVGQLADHPHLGRAGRVRGSRELVVSGTPYIVAYRIEADAVVILRLLHGKQKWPMEL